MEIQNHVIRNGEWVTETVNLQGVVKSHAQKAAKKATPEAPKCGLLTRTVVETQLAHFILPVRLRSRYKNDVAFVGDHFVQIRELQRDGQLVDVLRKTDFGSRIRNAAVVGSMPDLREGEKDESSLDVPIKSEDGDVAMDVFDGVPTAATRPEPLLPPQMLVLALESGHIVFLYIRHSESEPMQFDMFMSPRNNPPKQPFVQTGFHLTVDPSSSYMALGSAQRGFIVYRLNQAKTLEEQIRRGRNLEPVYTYRARSVQGVIHKMQFLYPRPGDDNHIILCLIIVKNGKSRIATYDWAVGDDLQNVFAEEKRGHTMPIENQLPIMLIPLRVNSALILVSEQQVAVCTGVLHSPNYESVTIGNEERPPTDNFHGSRQGPLWAAWARPYRLPKFFRTNDCIYLAREDGVIFFIEADSDSTVNGSLYIDKVDCGVSSAFTCLHDQFNDVLVMGSESSPGAIWKVPPRKAAEQLGTLPNWAPVVDVTTTDRFLKWNQEVGADGKRMVPWPKKGVTKPDRIFATSGKGAKGAITEYRYGLQARIGLTYDCGLDVVKQAFVLPALAAFFKEGDVKDTGFDLLLSLPDSTKVLRLSEQLDSIWDPSDEDSPVQYDLSCRTIIAVTACDSADVIVQVTERNIVLITASRVSRLSADKFGGLEPGTMTIYDAAVANRYIAVSTHSGTQFGLHLLSIEDLGDTVYLNTVKSWDIDGEVTCLSLCFDGNRDLLELHAGLCQGGRVLLGRAGMDAGNDAVDEHLETMDLLDGSDLSGAKIAIAPLEPIESIATCFYEYGLYTVIGFRNGETITLVDKDGAVSACRERLGDKVARVLMASEEFDPPRVLLCRDRELFMMTDFGTDEVEPAWVRAKTKHRVWPVDVAKPELPFVPVDSVTVLPIHMAWGESDTVPLLLTSGSTLLFTELHLQPGPAHRHIPIDGTPDRMLYSHHLKCLIVALRRGQPSLPTLAFIDPDTGEDIGHSGDHFARGLGREDDKVMAMAEWKYKQNGSTWYYLLLGMHKGRLLFISADRDREAPPDEPRVKYSTRFQKKGFSNPIYSVVGHEDKIIYCEEDLIRWDIIDATEKKLRTIDQYEVPSIASSLMMVNGRLAALTTNDSVEIIEPMPANSNGENGGGARLVHSDPGKRNTLHMIEVSGSPSNDPSSSLILVSDKFCGVSGLWTPWQTRGKDCETVFEAVLPSSIRKFVRGRTRPLWEQGQVRTPRYGRIAMTVDDAEIFGVCMDGSLVQFKLLDGAVQQMMRFILDIAHADEVLNPLLHEDDRSQHEEMHIDGDWLQRVLDQRALERLMVKRGHMPHFMKLLDLVEDGKLTDKIESKTDAVEQAGYIALAYRILEYFLAPVL